ncbi:MAG: response regulator [Planctomycetota bacterium]
MNTNSPPFSQHPDASLAVNPESNQADNAKQVVDSVFSDEFFDMIRIDAPKRGVRACHFQKTNARQPLILHIDDDEDLLDVLSMRFKKSGFRSTSALDGQSGVESALLLPADCIVLDYDMPNGRGDRVIDFLKSSQRTAGIPIVVLTAIGKKSVRRRMLSKGANAFLTKPFSYEELVSTIESFLSPGGNCQPVMS